MQSGKKDEWCDIKDKLYLSADSVMKLAQSIWNEARKKLRTALKEEKVQLSSKLDQSLTCFQSLANIFPTSVETQTGHIFRPIH